MLSFLSSECELSTLIRTCAWDKTPLGSPASWPNSLKTLVGVMLEANQPMFVVWGSAQTLIYNDPYVSFLGDKHPRALGRSFLDVWQEAATDLRSLVEAAYAGRASHMDDIPLMIERNGRHEEAHFACSYTPIRSNDGTVQGFFCPCNEITPQIEAARQVRDSETRSRQIFDSASDYAIVATDPAGIITSWNEGASRILGWTEAEMIGVPLDRFFTPEDRAADRPKVEMETALQTGSARDERWHLRKDGDRFWASGRLTVLRDLEERPVGFVKVLSDRTEQRDADERLRELNTGLEARVAEEVSSRLEAEEAMRQSQKVEAIGQLTGGVAHDFNNLLTVIRGSVDLLRRPDLPEERRVRYIDAISDTADRAASLAGQLLAFARRQTLRPETFDVAENIRAIRGMLGTLTGSRIVIDVEIADGRSMVSADRSQFDTALVNMAVNARDAMDGEGRLGLRVSRSAGIPARRSHPLIEGDFVAVAVTDSGSGIEAGQLDRIFEPFFTTKAVGEGTGLGLSQVFGFIKQSGGDIIVESAVGEGSTFTLYLPATVDVEEAVVVGAPLEAGRHGDGARILVVEDNTEVGRFATDALAELGYDTVLAVDGASALAELSSRGAAFDLVFTDVVMPGMSGIDLALEIGRLHPDLPVVLTSGYSSVLAEEGTHGLELLRKPYSIDELARTIGSQLRPWPSPAEARLPSQQPNDQPRLCPSPRGEKLSDATGQGLHGERLVIECVPGSR